MLCWVLIQCRCEIYRENDCVWFTPRGQEQNAPLCEHTRLIIKSGAGWRPQKRSESTSAQSVPDTYIFHWRSYETRRKLRYLWLSSLFFFSFCFKRLYNVFNSDYSSIWITANVKSLFVKMCKHGGKGFVLVWLEFTDGWSCLFLHKYIYIFILLFYFMGNTLVFVWTQGHWGLFV